MINRFALVVVATACCAMPAMAEEVGVGVGPVGVTVGSGPDRAVHEREVVREREPQRDEKVIVKKDRDPAVVEKKVIIDHRD
jgi:hypothetical protein